MERFCRASQQENPLHSPFHRLYATVIFCTALTEEVTFEVVPHAAKLRAFEHHVFISSKETPCQPLSLNDTE